MFVNQSAVEINKQSEARIAVVGCTAVRRSVHLFQQLTVGFENGQGRALGVGAHVETISLKKKDIVSTNNGCRIYVDIMTG